MQRIQKNFRRVIPMTHRVDTARIPRHRAAWGWDWAFQAMDDTQATALASTATLIEAVGRGSRPALKRLYDLESRRLYGIALRIVRRQDVAADVLQDAFVQVWQNAKSFAPERGAGGAWLTGIVRFRALDAVRKLGREIPSDDPTLGDEAVEPDVIDRLDAKAEAGALKRCLGLLDAQQRN